MPLAYKLACSLDIVETAFKHYMEMFCQSGLNECKFFDSERTVAQRIYLLTCSLNDSPYGFSFLNDELATVSMRKIGKAMTEMVIDDLPYEHDENEQIKAFGNDSRWIIEQKINKRKELRKKALDFLLAGLSNDGMFVQTGNKPSPKQKMFKEYVDEERLTQLRIIRSPEFDLSRLIRLCEELNICFTHECYHAIPMLIRAIIDHVPTIFGEKTFEQVISQHGTKSFKEQMDHLDKSLRKIADSYLHSHVRRKESLPNKTQVNFAASLDVLLAEIVRIVS